MRLSRALFVTLREDPAEAVVTSDLYMNLCP